MFGLIGSLHRFFFLNCPENKENASRQKKTPAGVGHAGVFVC
jgi:hypothetical protein